MDFVRSRKYTRGILAAALILSAVYCVVLYRVFLKGAAPTGVPVDWRNLPPRPTFPKYPLPPLPSSSHFPMTTARPTNHNSKPGLLTDKVSIDKIYRDLTIVTAFSENHYAEAMGLIGTVQQTMPEKKLVVYDLGIEPESLVKVKQLCNTELRRFPFENYPPHVSNLHTYAWKVIIINITLHEFGAIFWGDASVRFKDSLRHLVPYVLRHRGYMTHFHAFDTHGETDTRLGHIAFFTSPKMFAALGIKRTEYMSVRNATPFAAANRQLFVKNDYLLQHLVDPLLDCALKEACISPTGARLGKHRFDASALSLLIYKNMLNEWTPANNDNAIFDRLIDIRRTTSDRFMARSCPKGRK